MKQKALLRFSVEAPESVAAFEIQVFNSQRTKKINALLLKQITAALFAELKIRNAKIEINLVSAKKMAEINWQFLRHEGSTDVITFDYAETPNVIAAASPSLHGELFICVDEAILQSKKFKTNWQSETVRYLVHGILHLLGHDDLASAPKRKMKREENRLMRKLSFGFNLRNIGVRSKF